MTEYDNTNRGALFRNEDKQADTHADYRGSINIGGQEFWLDAWIKTSKKGTKYMSLSVKPKMARDHRGAPANPPPRREAESSRQDFDDDIPF
jgi:uncharacterized protein (DUF736 family)